MHLHYLRSAAVVGAATLTLATSQTGALAHERVPVAPPAPVRNAITVTTTGMNYHVRGHLRPGTAAISWVNADDDWHMMALARLKPGVSLRELTAALTKGEEYVGDLLMDGPDAAYGQPAALSGGQAETVTMTNLPAGHYVMLCFFTNRSGMPHWQMGMIQDLQVRGRVDHEHVRSEGTISLGDHGIGLPRHFDGHGTYAVKDVGSNPHNLSLAHLDHGTSLADFAGSVGAASESGGQPSGGELVGGIDALKPGQQAYLTLDLRPGRYGYISPEDITGPGLPSQSGTFTVHWWRR